MTHLFAEEVHRAYWAGLFDGEGSIGPFVQVNGTVSIRVSVTQKNWPFLEGLRVEFGGGISENQNSKGTWCLNLGGIQSCKKFLLYVSPYLILRKDEARWALVYLDFQLQRKRGLPLSKEEEVTRILILNKLEEASELRKNGFTKKVEEAIAL